MACKFAGNIYLFVTLHRKNLLMHQSLRNKHSVLRSLVLGGLAVAFTAAPACSLLAQDPAQTKTQVVVVTGSNDASSEVLKKLREQLKDLPEEQRDKILKQVETSLEQAMKSVPKAGASGTTESKAVTTTQTVIVNADGKATVEGDGKAKVYEQRRVVVVPKSSDGKNGATESNQTTLTVTMIDDGEEKTGKDGKKIKEFKILQGGPNGLLLQGEGKELNLNDLNNIAELKNMIPKVVQGQALPGTPGPSYRIGIAVEQPTGLTAPNEGLAVERVMEDSPASRAGITESDVIIKINGKKAEAFTQLQDAVQVAGASGKAVEIVLERDGKEVTVEVKPTKSEEAGAYTFSVIPQAGSIVSGEDLEGLKSGAFAFGQAIPVPGMPGIPGFQGGLALPAADNSELMSEIASLREEVSELKEMIKKLIKETRKSEEK